MDHGYRYSRWHHNVFIKHAIIATALHILIGVMAESSGRADGAVLNPSNRRLGWSNLAEVINSDAEFLTPPKISQVGSRKLQEEGAAGGTLRLRMVHRNAMESPARREFSSREAEIKDFIETDEMRVRGFYASVKNARGDGYTVVDESYKADVLATPSPSPAQFDNPAPAPSPEGSIYDEFQGRVVSGASFPGKIGQYFVEFYIGTPGQPFLFIADTGSDLVWVPCSLCRDCNAIATGNDTIFLPQNSSTFSPITCSSEECDLVPPPIGAASCSLKLPTSCTYAYGYSDSSQSTGVFAYDTVTMNSSSGKSVKIKNVAFGCGTNNSGPSITKVGGVIGLGQGPISFTSQVGYMYGNKFSYCFTNFLHTRSSSALIFGDDPMGTKLKGPIQYTPFVPNPLVETFYYVGIEAVEVGGVILPILSDVWDIDKNGNGGAVIDSGTTLSFFVQPAYDIIVQAFKEAIDYPLAPPTAGLSVCYNVSGISNPLLPSFSVVFKGNAVFKPPSKNYFLNPTDDLRCLGFMGSAANGGVSVLGNLLQQNYHVEYDRLHNRLGFAKAHCAVP